MDERYATPEEAARGDVDARHVRVLAVEFSPARDRALVFMEFNEEPHTEPYQVLCKRVADGWTAGAGSNGSEWLFTHHDPLLGDVGVQTLGWEPPTVRWDVPSAYA